MTVWTKCNGELHLTELKAKPWRIVESQSMLTSRNLVDTKEEYELLEEMLESSKPKIETNTHYLIFTPFRYPPLKYGSRFGRRFESSLWYGSFEIETALCETAYYRLLFLNHTEADLMYINIPLTASQALLNTKKGINLCSEPFNKYEQKISSKSDYTVSQKLGFEMRSAGVEGFSYRSAQSSKQGKNIAAFTHKIFHKKNGQYTFNFESWQCIASKSSVEFVSQSLKLIGFSKKDFYENGKLAKNPEWVN